MCCRGDNLESFDEGADSGQLVGATGVCLHVSMHVGRETGRAITAISPRDSFVSVSVAVIRPFRFDSQSQNEAGQTSKHIK